MRIELTGSGTERIGEQREDASFLFVFFLCVIFFLAWVTPHKLQINCILILSNRIKTPKENLGIAGQLWRWPLFNLTVGPRGKD